MARRSGRPPRSRNPHIIAASAILRSIESATPSRLTTLRLVADALILYTRSDPRSPAARNAIPGAHEPGARALLNAAVQVLLTLPTLGGALHRRALDLLRATAHAAGAATLLAAAERARAHMLQLRPAGIAEGDAYMETAFISAAHTVGETSRSDFAGRHAAEESVKVLLAVRGTRLIRAAAAHAAAYIIESFPANFAPETRLMDAACDALYQACAPAAVTKGNAPKPGYALLAGALVPRLFSRPQQAEKLLRSAASALANVPGSEKGVWAVTVVRVAIVARAARVKRAVREDFEKRKKKQLNPATRSGPPVGDQQLFETVLVTVARVSGLSAARNGCTLALIAVLRMWVVSLPQRRAVILSRAVAILAPEIGSVAAASMLRDALVTVVVAQLEPSAAYPALVMLHELSSTHGRVADALVVDLCSVLVRRFGAQAVLEPKGTEEVKKYTTLLHELIGTARTALATNFAAGRLAGVRLVTSLAAAVPNERVQLLTSILQGLRFGDLRLDGADGIGLEDLVSPRGAGRPNSVATGLAAVLGNAVALAALVEECTCCEDEEPVPKLVLKQVAVAAMNLMRPLLPASETDHYRERVATAIRRRAGWSIFAALGRAQVVEECVEGGMAKLFDHWRDDLGRSTRPKKDGANDGNGESERKESDMQKEPIPGSVGELILEPEETLAETSMRCSALAALAACLEHESSQELRQFAPYIIGAAAARVTLLRNPNPDISALPPLNANTSTIMEDPLFYRSSLNSTASLSDSSQPDRDNAQLSNELLYLAESLQIARCAIFAPPIGVFGELCYFVAVALGEDAQRAMGDAAGAPSAPGVVAQFLNSFNKPVPVEVAMAHRRLSLCTLRTKKGLSECSPNQDEAVRSNFLGENLAWMCSTEGVEMPVAEEAVVVAAHAISALVVEGISQPGSVCDEFCSSSSFSPAMSAVVALAVVRRISASSLSENGRVLAMLQVLVSKALKASVALQGADNTPTKGDGRNSTESPWNGTCLNDEDLPGAVFRRMAGTRKQATIFPIETPLRPIVYNSVHTRTLGIVFATRAVTKEAFRMLSLKGGTAMWQGLIKSATTSLIQSLKDKTITGANLACSSAAVIGTLLEVIPGQHGSETSSEGAEAVKRAVETLAVAMELGYSHAKAAAALALHPSLVDVANISERFMTALSRAWSLDDGADYSPGKVLKCAGDIAMWEASLERVCNRVLKVENEEENNSNGNSDPFLSPTVPNCALISPALATGAASVLTATASHCRGLVEASAVASAELCAELLHWEGVAAYPAQSAGFRGLVQMWMARIVMGRMQGVSGGPPRSPEGLLKHSLSAKKYPTAYVPIQFFSIRQPAQVGSSSGLFLEDAIYDAFLSGKPGIESGLQRAALNVVLLLLRETGRKAVSANFQRLPEILFKAAQDGMLECQNVLEILADADATKRPKYWIGLTRAVALGGKRLNAETKDAVWDVNRETRRLAVRIMRIAVTSSFARSKMANGTEPDEGNTEPVTHTCVLGCLKETLSAIMSVIKITPVDTATLNEACGALKVFAAKLQSLKRLELIGETAADSFKEQWVPIASALGELLKNKNSHRIIRIAAGTAVQWLLVGCFVETDEIKKESVKLCLMLFGKELAGITRRFEYLEKSDLCGTQTVISVLGSIAQLVSTRALHAALFGPVELDMVLGKRLPVLRNILMAAIVDFDAMQSVTCREEISRVGGAVSFPGPPGDDIRRCFEPYLPWLVMGANTVCGSDGRKFIESVSWLDDSSPGAEALRLDENSAELKLVNVCFAHWVSVMESSPRTFESLFDPCGVFPDIANFAGTMAVQCMHPDDQNSALAVVSRVGRSVEQIREAGVEKFGMLTAELEEGTAALRSMRLSSESPNAEEESHIFEELNMNKNGDDDEEEAVLDRGEEEEEVAMPEPLPADDAVDAEAEKKQNGRLVEKVSADGDGRLLRMPLDDSLNATGGDEEDRMPPPVITFDDIVGNAANAAAKLEKGPEGEPAMPFASVVTESTRQGIDITEPKPVAGLKKSPQSPVALVEAKPKLSEPAEPLAMNGVAPPPPIVGAGERVADDDVERTSDAEKKIENKDEEIILHDVQLDAELDTGATADVPEFRVENDTVESDEDWADAKQGSGPE